MMMKNTVLIILALFIGLTACKKDEETEPQQSKEDLLCHEWSIDKYTIDGNSLGYMNGFKWEFTKDGYLINTYIATGLSDSTTWQWANNKENIEIKNFDKNTNQLKSTFSYFKFDILTLSSSELIFESLADEEITRIELSKYNN